MSSHRLFTCHSQTLSNTESHSIPLPCISSSDISLLLSPIQPGSIRRHHQVRNNPLDRLLAHEFPCDKASPLCLALAITRLQVATPFPPCARTNYAGVVARSPQPLPLAQQSALQCPFLWQLKHSMSRLDLPFWVLVANNSS